jgi:membrane associated rhomboid family serine protease
MSRYDFPANEDHQPVTLLAGHAIYAAHFVVVVFVASLLATSLLLTFGGGHLLTWLDFNSDRVLSGQVWRILTYGLVNPPSLGFVIDMFMIVWFGRELEKFFGRRTFFILYGGLYFITPLLFTLIGLQWPLSLAGAPGALALFTAFATLYPNIPLIFGILAKWAAGILIGIYALMHLSSHDWPQLFALAATTGFAHAFVRYSQGRLTLPSFRSSPPRSTSREKPSPVAPSRPKPAPDSKAMLMAEMNELLDRISKSGIDSLTAKERARLETARASLLKSPRR